MPRRPARDLTVGVVAALALAVLAFAIMAVGGESRLFAPKTVYRVNFPQTEGLVVGSPVKLAGVEVGAVTDIHLPTDPAAVGIEVTIGVDRRYAARVREDSQAAQRILQLVSREKYVEITPGSPDAAPLPQGSVIPLLEETALLEQGQDIAQNLSEITLSLRQILAPLVRGEGLLGEMIHNPEFGKEGLAWLVGTFENLEALTGQLREGRGFVGRALYDEEFSSTIDDLSRGIESFASLMESLGGEDQSLGELLQKEGVVQQAMQDLRDAAASLKRTADRLESHEGLVGRLLNDPEYSRQLADDLQATVHNLAQITRKINEGEGTLGLLVNERTLHDGAEDVVAGVNDSKFARWLVRRYQKKGIKAQEAEAEEADAEAAAGTEYSPAADR